MLTIVMYHYVRDLPNTRYPRINGLLTRDFESQLDYIERHYTVCGIERLRGAIIGEDELPPDACVLTFDDGLVDHYETVFPRLLDRGLCGAFFPPARAVEDAWMLDVHKIHFILAAAPDGWEVARDILGRVEAYRGRFDIPSGDELWKRCAIASRFDPPEVIFIKRMLQWVLPRQVRSEIAAQLFARYVTHDEIGFAAELYMGVAQLCEMAACGMEIGGHGYEHLWMGELDRREQAWEIARTVSFLDRIYGREPRGWAMCYPFGSYNTDTVDLLFEAGCAIGLTTRVGLADLAQPMGLARLDTMDLPFAGRLQPPVPRDGWKSSL